MTKPLTELFESKIKVSPPLDEQRHSDFTHGLRCESDRRKPIDLATKKLIEALETVLMQCISIGAPNSFNANTARKALAEFRASLEESDEKE